MLHRQNAAPQQDLSEVTRAHLGMMLWALIVGLSFPAVGLLSEGLPPLLLTSLRFAIAALALLPAMHRLQNWWPGLHGLLLYATMGLCLAGFFGAMFWSAHHTSALAMATLYVSVPLLAYMLGRMLGVEQPRGRLLATLALGAVGALALGWAEHRGASTTLQLGKGEALFAMGCIASALYTVLSKWGLERRVLSADATLRSFWSLVTGGVLIALLGGLWESPRALAGMVARDIWLLVYLGVLSSSVTFWLQQRATEVLTPGAVMAYSYLIPFVSMLLLFAAHPERIGWHWLPGSVLVVLAIAVLLRSKH